MEFWMIRRNDALVCADTESAAQFAKVPYGKVVRVEIVRPRNAKHHRLFWTLCARIANAVGCEPETVSDLLKVETGHCTTIKSKKYGELRIPKSISFAAMDQNAFVSFFDRCVNVINSEWGIARKDVLEAVDDLLNPTEITA